MNKELLLRTAAAIEANPEHFDMDDYYIANCGTTACIAGWAVFLAKGCKDFDRFVKRQESQTTWQAMKKQRKEFVKALEIRFYSAQFFSLVTVADWANIDLRNAYYNATENTEKARLVAEYVRWFVAQGDN